MKAVISSLVLAALLGLASAKVELTNSNFDDIKAGSTFKITWDDAEGPVTLTLKDGPEGDLKDVQTIAAGVGGTSFQWPVDAALPEGKYAIEISDGSDVNYSEMFTIDSTVTASATSSSASVTSTTATPSSTSTTVTSTSSSAESSSTESSSTESTSTKSSSSSAKSTSSESSTATSSSASASTTLASSTVTRTTSSAPTSTESSASQTSVPNSNDAQSMMAPLVPGLLAMLGAALI
ncbi:Ser-Thr-rich glycosyl-phosphatidyl-inositol-anchored membrane family-domain-containing protein [Xylaria venustula]|nr:Ser-Thr-rich glycosyl-phosphatidyl-inositol-anchored membrane family-domain-containing protein [Xylaria venustula]